MFPVLVQPCALCVGCGLNHIPSFPSAPLAFDRILYAIVDVQCGATVSFSRLSISRSVPEFWLWKLRLALFALFALV